MAGILEKAARVTSPVEHGSSAATDLATPAGLAVGVVVTIFAPEVTLIGAAAAIIGWMGTGNLAGHLADKYAMPNDASERIIEGVPNVLVDEPKHQAANAGPKTLTDQHRKEVKTGALHCYIENRPFARKTDMTKCDGKIMDGSAHVFVGGSPTEQSGDPGQVVNGFTENAEFVLDVVGVTTIPKGTTDTISYLKGLAEKSGVDFGPIGDAYDTVTTIFDFK